MIYEKDCAKVSTAVKAVWLLYRRGRWKQLEELGMTRALTDKLRAYDDIFIEADFGKVRGEEQVRELIKAVPEVLRAATLLLASYVVLTASDNPDLDTYHAKR